MNALWSRAFLLACVLTFACTPAPRGALPSDRPGSVTASVDAATDAATDADAASRHGNVFGGAVLDRRARIVEASAVGVHAYQLLLTRRSSKGDPQCWASALEDVARLEALVAHHTALLAEPVGSVLLWASGERSAFDPSRDLDPLLGASSSFAFSPRLPLRVVAADLESRGCGEPIRARALATLYQLILEVERDGDVLQAQLRLYAALGLPISAAACGMPGTDADFLDVGRRLAGASCASPYEVDPKAWQIAGRKLWNWGEKLLGVRDGARVADELWTDPEVQKLIPRLEALTPRRIVVLGHSYTMAAHWASPASFTDLAARIALRANPGVHVVHVSAGGLTASRALNDLLPKVLGERPDEVLLVLLLPKEEDFVALRAIGAKLRGARVRSAIFDEVTAPLTLIPASGRTGADAANELVRLRAVARDAGISVLDVGQRLLRAPDRDRFVCLDGDHMTEPYHRFMARAWLAQLAQRSR